MSPNSQFDASGSLAGYLYQCRLALLLGLREIKTKPNSHISIEKFDDISFQESDYAHCILQAKHHIGPKDLSDTSVDLWKTFRIWVEQFGSGTFTNADTKRVLITTAVAPNNSAMSKLRADSSNIDRSLALPLLREAARTSRNVASRIGREAFLKLTDEEAKLLLSSVTVLDRSPNLHDVFSEIESELLIVSLTAADRVAQALEGWWLSAVSKRLVSEEATEIPVQHIAIKTQELAAMYGPMGLPVSDPHELGEKPYDENDEDQTYVKQMRLVELGEPAIRRGIQDFYRSNAQRSLWARESLLLDGDVSKYERKLQDQWERYFEATCTGVAESDEVGKRDAGRKVFFWASQQQIEFRNVVEIWITAGTFHNLSDKLSVGWHPNFSVHLNKGGEDE